MGKREIEKGDRDKTLKVSVVLRRDIELNRDRDGILKVSIELRRTGIDN